MVNNYIINYIFKNYIIVYENNNILHGHILNLVRNCLKSKNQRLIKNVIKLIYIFRYVLILISKKLFWIIIIQ